MNNQPTFLFIKEDLDDVDLYLGFLHANESTLSMM
jgi:hypothetical protein